MDNTLDDLQETFVCSTIADVEQLQQEHEEFKNGGLKEAETKYSELSALTDEMAALGSTDNTYTTFTPTVCGGGHELEFGWALIGILVVYPVCVGGH